MLARLESLKDRGEVEVDRSGTYVRVRPPGLGLDVVRVLKEQGVTARLLESREAAGAEAGATAWFSRATIRELSREEYRILARRWAGEFRGQANLSELQEARIVESPDREIDSALEKLPRTGELPSPEQWHTVKTQALEGFLKEAEGYLSTEQLPALRAFMEERLGG